MTLRPITDDDLHSYVDQQLAPGRAEEVRAYLADHPEVSARIAGYAEQRERLRVALAPIAEEPLPSRLNLTRMIDAQRRPSGLPWWASAAAAVALILLGGVGGWSLNSLSHPAAAGIASLASEAAECYAVFAPDHIRPVELHAADRVDLVDWLTQRLGHQVAAPDLSSAGYRFMGGRMVATAHGPAALFMYDDDHGTRLVLLARPMPTERDSTMSPLAQNAVNGFAWAEHGMGYSLVGPPSAEILHPIADAARRQIANDI